MPHVVANTNDDMRTSCNMHAPASGPSLDKYYAPENTYVPAICASQITSTKINCFTLL